MPYNFTLANKQTLHGNKTGGWSTAVTWAMLPHAPRTVSGITYQRYIGPGSSAKDISQKDKIMNIIIPQMQAAGIMFQQADVQEFRVCYYDNDGASRGVVYFDTPVAARPIVVLMLGTRVKQHIVATMHYHATNLPIRGGGGHPPRIIADRVYDYYKKTWTVNAAEKCALTQAYHEMGHVFHQLTDPANFHLNGEVAMSHNTVPGVPARLLMLPNVKNAGCEVSQYACRGNAALNEFVAEVFSGFMIGVDWGTVDPAGNVMTQYGLMGGPVPPHQPYRMSRLPAFKNQRCNCAGGPMISNWN